MRAHLSSCHCPWFRQDLGSCTANQGEATSGNTRRSCAQRSTKLDSSPKTELWRLLRESRHMHPVIVCGGTVKFRQPVTCTGLRRRRPRLGTWESRPAMPLSTTPSPFNSETQRCRIIISRISSRSDTCMQLNLISTRSSKTPRISFDNAMAQSFALPTHLLCWLCPDTVGTAAPWDGAKKNSPYRSDTVTMRRMS